MAATESADIYSIRRDIPYPVVVSCRLPDMRDKGFFT